MKAKTSTILILLMCLMGSIAVSAQSTITVPDDGDPLNEVINSGFVDGNTYVLERGGYYVLSGAISVTGDINIIAEDGDGDKPFIVTGTDEEGGSLAWGMFKFNGDIVLQGLHISVSNDLGGRGAWNNAMCDNAGANKSATFDDCIIDFSDGYIYGHNNVPANKITFTNNLIRWGGYIGGGNWQGFGFFFKNGDIGEVVFENNTFVECIAPFMVHENSLIGKVWFNHNTIVSHAQFLHRCEYWTEAVYMNNLFVDAHFAGEAVGQRTGQDPEGLPYGVITIATYANDTLVPAGFPDEADRAFLIAYNANYVSPSIKDYWDNADSYFSEEIDWQVADYTKGDNGFLNSRAYSMMRDSAESYPYFLYNDDLSIFTDAPGFTNYTYDTEDPVLWARAMNGDTTAADPSLEAGSWGIHPNAEFPMAPVAADYQDFSYSNSTYANSAHQGYPLGDLNWWPDEKAEWEADAERETFDMVIAQVKDGTFEFASWADSTGVGIFDHPAHIGGVTLEPNYPNPATGSTNIRFHLSESTHVCIKIMNVLGQLSKVVADENLPAGSHDIMVSLKGLESGNYFYQLQTDSEVLTRKMVIQ